MAEQGTEIKGDGVITSWGDKDLRQPDIKPGEGSRLYRKDKFEKEKEDREKAKANSSPEPMTETTTKRVINGEPGNPESVVPMNDEMIRQRKDGTYYRVKIDRVSSRS